MSAEQNLKTVQSMYEAFGRGDVPAILAGLSDEIAWESWSDNHGQKGNVSWMAPRHGKGGAAEFLQTLQKELKFDRFEVRSLLAGGHQVAVEVVIDAQVNATGKRLADETLHLWTFNDAGQAIRYRQYVDTAKHLAASK